MESRFAHLRQRDASVSMLRTKMSRRKSQSQKENRERTVNTRRQLSVLDNIQEIKPTSSKVEDRLKQLERWKERKALEKENTKREKERKGVFKTGLYHPKDTLDVAPLPDVPAASTRAKEKKMDWCQNTRVTRSMKQQPLRMEDPNAGTKKAQAAVERSSRTRAAAKTNSCGEAARAPSTRSANRPPAAAARPQKDQSKSRAADVRTTRSRPVAPSAGGEKKVEESVPPAVLQEQTQEQEEVPGPPACPQEEAMVEEPAPPLGPMEPRASRFSFAPAGFVFQAPVGLPAFKFDPMTPRSADAFLTPSPVSLSPGPVYAQAPPPASPSVAPCSLESKHDVPYFRSEMSKETDRLTTLSLHWESKVEDESIPEEMRDGMRTAVGQARLLMKERFHQFSGLVDDCELQRGDKVTTCMDLQGFWDMVSYQVDDVKKKFDALREAEVGGWKEEQRPPPPRRRALKKPSAAPAKPPGAKAVAAAKSRLAAVKAAMKARQQAEAGDDTALNPGKSQPSPAAQTLDQVVFDGGFFKVESPVKPPGSVRRSNRLSSAAPHNSNCSSYLSPRRLTRRSLALLQSPAPHPASPAPPPAPSAPLSAPPAPLSAPPAPLPAPSAPLPAPSAPLSAPPAPLPAPSAPLPAPSAPLPAPSAPLPAPSAPLPAPPAETPAPLPAPPAETPAPLPASPASLPAQLHPLLHQSSAPRSRGITPLRDSGNVSLCFSPVNEELSAGQEENGGVPQLISSRLTLPSIAVVGVEMETTETVDVDLRLSSRLSAESTWSPSPSGGPAHSAVVSSRAHQSLCLTPDELPGLDFERYLQPSLRGGPSPLETDRSALWSPAGDVEMLSPRGERDEPAAQEDPVTPATSSAFSLQSPQVQTLESPMLLFTPDIKDKIRASVCPSDLMVFTPPSF